MKLHPTSEYLPGQNKEDMIMKLVAEQNLEILQEIECLKRDTKHAFLELAKAKADANPLTVKGI